MALSAEMLGNSASRSFLPRSRCQIRAPAVTHPRRTLRMCLPSPESEAVAAASTSRVEDYDDSNDSNDSYHSSRSRGDESGEVHLQHQGGRGSGGRGGNKKGIKTVRVSHKVPAGQTAANLANILRADRHARLIFIGCKGAMSALKALAISNQFLNQHGQAVSFQPTYVEEFIHTEATDSHNSSGYWTLSWSLSCFSRKVMNVEIDLKTHAMMDFSLDVRQVWGMKATISDDLAYSVADLLYGQLRPIDQPGHVGPGGAAGNSMLQRPAWLLSPQQQVAMRSVNPSGAGDGSSSSSNSSGSEASRKQQLSQPVLISADMAQAPTILAAVSLFERRLQQEGGQYSTKCTLYRNTVAPRLDGRNGYIFKIQIVDKTNSFRVKKQREALSS
eukprot:gene9099-16225_t